MQFEPKTCDLGEFLQFLISFCDFGSIHLEPKLNFRDFLEDKTAIFLRRKGPGYNVR